MTPGTEEEAFIVFAVPDDGLGLVRDVVTVGVSLDTWRTKFALDELPDPSAALMVYV